MVTLIINGQSLQLGSFWYHYKRLPSSVATYLMNIPLNEIEIIECIQQYAECKIDAPELSGKIVRKDMQNASMGLMWQIGLIFNERGWTKNVDRVKWVIENIKEIKLENDQLVITGNADYFVAGGI